MLRTLSRLLIAAIAFTAPPPPLAHGKTTCHEDERGRNLCCEMWRVKIYASDKENGRITEPDFDKLARRVESHRETARSLCAFGFQSDCGITYGPSHCADSNALRTPPERLLERRDVQAVIDNARNLIRHWGQTLPSAAREVSTADGQKNPYRGLGSAMAAYADALRDARDKLREMREILARVDEQVTVEVIRELDRHAKDFEHRVERLLQARGDLPPGDQARLTRLPPLRTASPNGAGTPPAAPPVPRRAEGGARTDQRHGTDDSSRHATNSGTVPDTAAPRETSLSPDRSARIVGTVNASCPDLTHCLHLIDAVWRRSDSTSGQRRTGTMSIKLTNTCATPLRLALWLPQDSGYAPSYFRLTPNATTSRTATGTRNEWHIQASQTNASDQCLKYP